MPTLAKRYAPTVLLVTCLVCRVAGFVSEPSTFGTSELEVSTIVSVMVALSWHHAWGASTESIATRASRSTADRLDELRYTIRPCARCLRTPSEVWGP